MGCFQQEGIARQLIFPLCPLSEKIQLDVQPAASDEPREKKKERKKGKRKGECEFITINAN